MDPSSWILLTSLSHETSKRKKCIMYQFFFYFEKKFSECNCVFGIIMFSVALVTVIIGFSYFLSLRYVWYLIMAKTAHPEYMLKKQLNQQWWWYTSLIWTLWEPETGRSGKVSGQPELYIKSQSKQKLTNKSKKRKHWFTGSSILNTQMSHKS